jgi:hypothetical protein
MEQDNNNYNWKFVLVDDNNYNNDYFNQPYLLL